MTPLLILVGLTGCGKSTAVNALHDVGLAFTLLPNRRELTDELIIRHMQALEGATAVAVTDRVARFEYTRRYRELYPGGMAHALSQWLANPERQLGGHAPLVFDGLRGANEVTHAAALLPQAWFLFLDAPDFVRVQRLLGRGDVFDQVVAKGNGVTAVPPELSQSPLTASEQERLLNEVAQGQIGRDDLIAKLTIVNSERQNYDPAATLQALREYAPQQLIYADTTTQSPEEIAHKVKDVLRHE